MSPLRMMGRWSRRTAVAAGVGVLTLALAMGVALAYWSGSGDGDGDATTTTLNPPTNVNAVASFNTVNVTWTRPTPPGGTLTGFYVQRDNGPSLIAACGTTPGTPASYLAGTAASCSDTAVPNGNYTYVVTAVFRSWTSDSNPSNSIVVNGDANPPSQTVSIGTGPVNAYFAANRLYYRPDLSGSFTLRNALTDNGAGPASTTFPAIGATGWTHPAQTVSTGTGSPPTITYTSSTYSWVSGAAQPATQTITGRDQVANQITTNVAFVPDATAPASGAVSVNGVAATAAGSTSFRTNTNTFSITGRVDYAETQSATQSGLASSVLTRQTATLANGVCGTFGAATTLTGSPSQTGLATGCYRYTLTGTDNLVNVASLRTTVIVDTSAPTHALTQVNPVNAAFSATRNRVYYRSAVAGSFQMRDTVTDAQSGPASSTFPATTATGWTHAAETVSIGTGSAPTIAYTSGTYSWNAGAGQPANGAFVGRNLVGGTATSTIRFRADDTAPTGGVLTVNGTTGTSAGATSSNTSGSWTIGRTDYTEGQTNNVSGLASSVLTRETAPLGAGVCGTYAAPTTLTGAPAQTGVAGTCYRFRLVGTDLVGNTASLTVVVRVAPAVSAMQLQNGGTTAGRLGQGDRAVITFSQPVNPQSFCSAWGTSGNQTLNASNDVTVTLTNTTSDTLTVASASCTFNLGSIALGSGNYTTANASFVGAGANASTIAWNATTNTLTITLGATTSGSLATVGSSAATYTPSAAITDPFGVPVSGSFTTGTVQQF